MIVLPVSTQFGRRIPKQKFYENLSISPQIKRIFIEQINYVLWRNKIAPTTVNIAAGSYVTEIEIFEIKLNQRGLDERVLHFIDKGLPYHILFLLTYEDECQAWIGYKEKSSGGSGAFKQGTYYNTEWMPIGTQTLRLVGLNMDAVYENFIRQIAGDRLSNDASTDIKTAISADEQRQKLQDKIAALEKKVQREKQFNIQVELNAKLRRLKKALETLLF